MVETAQIPTRSLQQRSDALKKANKIRIHRAEVKKDLKAGRIKAVDLILDPPEMLKTMHLIDLLLAIPRKGRVKANRILTLSRCSPSKTIGGLSERQRQEIALYLQR